GLDDNSSRRAPSTRRGGRLQATRDFRFGDGPSRKRSAPAMNASVVSAWPGAHSLRSTSIHLQRGVDNGKPGAGGGNVPSATHRSQVSGEIRNSAAPSS